MGNKASMISALLCSIACRKNFNSSNEPPQPPISVLFTLFLMHSHFLSLMYHLPLFMLHIQYLNIYIYIHSLIYGFIDWFSKVSSHVSSLMSSHHIAFLCVPEPPSFDLSAYLQSMTGSAPELSLKCEDGFIADSIQSTRCAPNALRRPSTVAYRVPPVFYPAWFFCHTFSATKQQPQLLFCCTVEADGNAICLFSCIIAV